MENRKIIHWWYQGYNNEKRYLCNGACGTTKEKIAHETKDVTCKNCLHLLSTREYLNTVKGKVNGND